MSEAKLIPAPGSEVLRIPNLPALSIRQPWAWAILHAGKDIENRNWPTKFRGRFLIHAAKGCTLDEYVDACAYMDTYCGGVNVPAREKLERGGIVGMATIVDCVGDSDSDWFVGEWGFVLADVRTLPFTPCRGALGFFYPQNTKPSGGTSAAATGSR